MKITTATIDDANRRMEAIANDESIGDGYERLAKMAEVWEPISDSIDSADIPGGMEGMFERYGKDFFGVTHDGRMIVWGAPRPMPGADSAWRPLLILGPLG